MPSRINAETANLFRRYRTTTDKIHDTVEQLSTGRRLVRPGDEVADFERSAILGVERIAEFAKMQAMQSRLSWYQTSVSYLEKIREVSSQMATLSMQAKSGTASVEDHLILDKEFQDLKTFLSKVIDGQGGSQLPKGVFGNIPLFLEFSPGVTISNIQEEESTSITAVSLYTAHQREGFPVLPLLSKNDLNVDGIPEVTPKFTGTALSGTVSTITLSEQASSIDNVFSGMQINIVGGTGSGQSAIIETYDGSSRTATFREPLTVALDATSEFSIDSDLPNHSILSLGGVEEVRFAESVWGADNYRLDHLSENIATFKPLTQEETDFRLANGIQDTDLDARTNEEKYQRRRLNIFDRDFGNLLTKDNASRMLAQINNAIDQISVFISREDAKAETLKSQYDFFTHMRQQKDLGIQNFSALDFAKSSVSLNDLTLAHDMIFEVATRLSENFSKLNDLVKKGGRG